MRSITFYLPTELPEGAIIYEIDYSDRPAHIYKNQEAFDKAAGPNILFADPTIRAWSKSGIVATWDFFEGKWE